eukprot:1557989-Prymnesium_polylepis.1
MLVAAVAGSPSPAQADENARRPAQGRGCAIGGNADVSSIADAAGTADFTDRFLTGANWKELVLTCGHVPPCGGTLTVGIRARAREKKEKIVPDPQGGAHHRRR